MNFFRPKANSESENELPGSLPAHAQGNKREPAPKRTTDRSANAKQTAGNDLERALERLTMAIESGEIGIWDWDVKLGLTLWDDWMYRLYGVARDERLVCDLVSHESWTAQLHPDDRAAVDQAVADALSGADPFNTEFRIIWKDGSIHHLRGAGHVTRDTAGQPLRMVGINWDITPLRQAEQARDELQTKFDSILQNMKGYIFQRAMSTDGEIYHPFVSDSLYQMLGVTVSPGLPPPDITSFVSPLDLERVLRALRQSARDFLKFELEFRLNRQDGQEIWVNSRGSIRRLDDGTIIWDGFGTDITAEKRTAHQLFYLTYHDQLTGLDNRLGFESALENALHEATKNQVPFVIFFIDIADFRQINDALGVRWGDLIIQETAERLTRLAGDDAIVARIAGDEFALLKCGLTKAETTQLTVEILAALGEPVRFAKVNGPAVQKHGGDENNFSIVVNVGIAGSKDEATGNAPAFYHDAVSEYMKRCDIALYEAKRLGRGRFCHYTHEIDHRISNRMVLRQSLHQAVAAGEFILHYQPILDLRSGQIIAAEALVRWQHPKLGFQTPDQFIPLAEESGLIVPLGAWVLKTSMYQSRRWRAEFGLRKIAVNVSAVQFAQSDFVDMVKNLLLETGASPDMIELELTETMLVDCSAEMLERMNSLRGLGFTLAIDDFGTGYSSLKYLSKLPVDKLKIDQCFVRQMTDESNDATIVRAIVALGKGLNLEVFAEGVETPTQQNFLVAQGCFYGQGYLFSRPVPPKDFVAVFQESLKLMSL